MKSKNQQEGKSNVIFFIADLGDGGAQKQCALTAVALTKHTHVNCSVLAIRGGRWESFLRENGIRVRVTGHNSGFDLRNAFRLKGEISRLEAGLVVSWLHSADVQTFLARFVSKPFKWIMTERDSRYPRKLRYSLRFYAGKFSDLVVANSSAGIRLWRRKNPALKIIKIPNIAPSPAKQKKLSSSYDIVMVGRLEAQKNAIRGAEVLAEIVSRHCDVSAAIMGDGSQKPQIEAKLLERKERVEMLGYVQGALDIIAGAKVLLSLSRHEGLPNVVLEAIASNTLPVVSRIPAHEEIFGSDYSFLVDLDYSDEEIVSVVERALALSEDEIEARLEGLLRGMTEKEIAHKYLKAITDLERK